jgi:hypothetical protein
VRVWEKYQKVSLKIRQVPSVKKIAKTSYFLWFGN